MKERKQEKRVIKVSPKKVLLAVLLVWAISIGGTWYLATGGLSRGNDFPLLNPRLKTFGLNSPEERNAKLFATLMPLKEQILESLGENKDITAFYIEDLNTGSWSGWKERDPFIPASLLKVPVAIGVMKKVERGEWTLDKRFVLEEKYKDKYFGDLWKKPEGTDLSVDELLKEMLQNSDNTAANIFFQNLTREEREDVYYHIGMVNPEIRSENNTPLFSALSSKDLASMFRALYNATYLTRKSSSYLLDILSDTRFDKIISTSMPKDIKVAHKIGNYYNRDPKRSKDYHDCGIAYAPKHPYLYCVMTKDLNPDKAEPLITDISNKIYLYFEKKGK